MLPTNLWVTKELKEQTDGLFKKRRMDFIPAICKDMDGFVLVSLTSEEVGHVLSNISTKHTVIDCTGTVTAQVKGTSILVDVASVHLEK